MPGEVAKAIEPGSTEQGDRAALEQGLQQVSGGAASAPGQAPPAAGGLNIPEDPIGGLLSGQVNGNPDLPITDGLSVGPGAGADTGLDPSMQTSRAAKVRDLAMNASTPAIRAAARNELRRMLREPV